jgi:hypothetical protein
MHFTVQYTRFFRQVYNFARCSYVVCGIYIRIIHLTTILTGKNLTLSKGIFFQPYMQTYMAGLTWVSSRNSKELYTAKFSLIIWKLTNLVKTPMVQFCLMCFTFRLCSSADITQIFNSNPFIFRFGFCYYLLTYCVIDYRNESAFSATKPFQEFFRTLCAFALNTCSYFRISFSNIFKLHHANRILFLLFEKKDRQFLPDATIRGILAY